MVSVRSITWFLLFLHHLGMTNSIFPSFWNRRRNDQINEATPHRPIRSPNRQHHIRRLIPPSANACTPNSKLPRITDVKADNVDAGSCACSRHGSIQCLPTLVVIGIEKAGTGEMIHWLGSHPQVRFAPKELRFFSREGSTRPIEIQRYMGLRHFTLNSEDHGRGVMTGEKSPEYTLNYCLGSKQLAEVLPSVKILTIIKDPAARAYSSFHHHCQRKRLRHATNPDGSLHPRLFDWTESSRAPPVKCTAEEFDNFIETAKLHFRERNLTVARYYETKDKADHCLPSKEYFGEPYGVLSHGIYATAFEEYYKYFNRSQLHYVFSEDFVQQPLDMMATIESFMGLPHHQYRARKNQNGFYKLVGPRYHSKGDRRMHPPASESAKEWLRDFYAAERARLANLLPDLRNRFEAWSPGKLNNSDQHLDQPLPSPQLPVTAAVPEIQHPMQMNKEMMEKFDEFLKFRQVMEEMEKKG